MQAAINCTRFLPEGQADGPTPPVKSTTGPPEGRAMRHPCLLRPQFDPPALRPPRILQAAALSTFWQWSARAAELRRWRHLGYGWRKSIEQVKATAYLEAERVFIDGGWRWAGLRLVECQCPGGKHIGRRDRR